MAIRQRSTQHLIFISWEIWNRRNDRVSITSGLPKDHLLSHQGGGGHVHAACAIKAWQISCREIRSFLAYFVSAMFFLYQMKRQRFYLFKETINLTLIFINLINQSLFCLSKKSIWVQEKIINLQGTVFVS
jgi:hypothetical protein